MPEKCPFKTNSSGKEGTDLLQHIVSVYLDSTPCVQLRWAKSHELSSRPCVCYATIRIVRLALVEVAFVPHRVAELLARVDCLWRRIAEDTHAGVQAEHVIFSCFLSCTV